VFSGAITESRASASRLANASSGEIAWSCASVPLPQQDLLCLGQMDVEDGERPEPQRVLVGSQEQRRRQRAPDHDHALLRLQLQ